MKNCTPREAWRSVRFCGLFGLSDGSPFAVEENVPVYWLTMIEDWIVSSDAARRGNLKYSYSVMTNSSR
jgi:hypothetical protein